MTASTLRVCWLVPGFPADAKDTAYTFLAREASELVATRRVDLTVITEGGFDPDEAREFELVRLTKPQTVRHRAHVATRALCADPIRLPRFFSAPARTYATLWRLGELTGHLRRGRFDVLHSHFATPNGTAGLPVAQGLGVPVVISLRGADVVTDADLGYGLRLDPTFDREIKSSLGRADLCLTATSRMRQIAIDAGAASDRTVVLPNSFDHSWLGASTKVSRPAAARYVFLSVGHLTRRKGFDRGIQALARMPTDYHYVIVGEGPDRARLERIAAELGVDDRTHLLGAGAPADVAGWMVQSDGYWFLSRIEAFGNVLLEAYAAGLPIIAATEGVAKDLLEGDDSCRLLARPDDSERAGRALHPSDEVEDPPSPPTGCALQVCRGSSLRMPRRRLPGPLEPSAAKYTKQPSSPLKTLPSWRHSAQGRKGAQTCLPRSQIGDTLSDAIQAPNASTARHFLSGPNPLTELDETPPHLDPQTNHRKVAIEQHDREYDRLRGWHQAKRHTLSHSMPDWASITHRPHGRQGEPLRTQGRHSALKWAAQTPRRAVALLALSVALGESQTPCTRGPMPSQPVEP